MFRVYLGLVFCANLFVSISANKTNSTILEWFENSENGDLDLPLVRLDNKSYYIESILKADFFQAQRFCTYHGMQLVSITSQAENDFLEKKLKHLGVADQHYWTSATRLAGRWAWMSTGRPLMYTNWHPGEPNNARDKKEDCVEIRIYDRGLTWNDLTCANNMYFICEIYWPKRCLDLINKFNHTITTQESEERVQTV